MKKILALTLSLCLLIALPTGCSKNETGDQYPDKSIQMVMGYSAGGATDIIYRRVAASAEKALGQTLVPVNMGGAGGTLATQEVRKAEADGYTLLAHHDAMATANLIGLVDYSFEAFTPVCLLTATPNIFVVNKETGITTVQDFIDRLNEEPGSFKVGLTPGSTDHFFIAEMLTQMGMSMDSVKMVSYPGTSEINAALLSGEIDGGMTNYTSGKGYFEEGTFVAVAVANDERLTQMPDTPTFQENDIDFIHATNRGIFLPKDTPEDIVLALEDAFRQAMEDPEVIKDIEDMGNLVHFLDHTEYAEFVEQTQETYEALAAGMDLD